jgi:hypothetical protein
MSASPRRSSLVREDVLKQESEPFRRLLLREDLSNQGEDIVHRVQVEHFDELTDVCRRIPARGGVGASLLVQPPPGQAKLGRHGQRLFMHDAVRFEQRVTVTGSPPGIVGKGHSSAAEHLQVRDHAAPGEPLAETAESILDALPVEQRRGITHAASIS